LGKGCEMFSVGGHCKGLMDLLCALCLERKKKSSAPFSHSTRMSCHVSYHVWYVTLKSGLWGTAHAASSSHRVRNI